MTISVDEMHTGFIARVRDARVTINELERAYESLWGVSDIPDTQLEPEIARVLADMREMVKAGFPKTRFAELISLRRDYEKKSEQFYAIVGRLNTSEKCKRLLRSIVAQNRSGVLTLYAVNTPDVFDDITIKPREDSRLSRADISVDLIEYLKDVVSEMCSNGEELAVDFDPD